MFLAVFMLPVSHLAAEDAAHEQRLVQIQQAIEKGDLASARAGLEGMLLKSGRDPRIFNFLGVIDAQERHLDAAERNFRHAIQQAPRFTGAYLNLGRLYQEGLNAPAKALEVYGRLLAFDSENAEANYQSAFLLNQAGKFGLSLEHLSRLSADAQQRAPALALLCADNAALGKRDLARTAATRLAAAADLTEADVLPILASLQDHRAGDLEMQLLEALAERGLGSRVGLQALAGLQEKQGLLKQARATLEKDLQVEPPSAAVLVRLAKLAYQTRDFEGALGYLAHARDLEPRNASIHFFFGMVCIELKLPPEARQSLAKAAELDPGQPEYQYALGAVLLQEKKAEEAIPHFRQYRDSHPGDPRGNFALGVAYFDAYQVAEARKELELAAARPETRVGANFYLGRLALREDNLDEAAERLKAAVQSNPAAPDAYAELGLVYIRRKQFALAETSLKHALKIAPDHYLSNLNLLMLYQRTKDPRAPEQARHVEQLQKAGEERERLLLRSLELRPY